MISPEGKDPYLETMKAARKSPSVLKTQLAQLRAALPNIPIFALEGLDDKPVYASWVRRLRPRLVFEPFLCDGKSYVMQLKSALDRDLGGLKEGVYFFVDRDFDDLRGHEASESVFMTESYSVENYLVDPIVLEEILKDELHCQGKPAVRRRLIDLFKRTYAEFLKETYEINFRIYMARRLNIVILDIPDKISKLVDVTLYEVKRLEALPASVIRLAVEPDPSDILEQQRCFAALDPVMRFRGKFAYAFFMKWLKILSEERVKRSTELMIGVDRVNRTRCHEISLGTLASRSPIPSGLEQFLSSISDLDTE